MEFLVRFYLNLNLKQKIAHKMPILTVVMELHLDGELEPVGAQVIAGEIIPAENLAWAGGGWERVGSGGGGGGRDGGRVSGGGWGLSRACWPQPRALFKQPFF